MSNWSVTIGGWKLKGATPRNNEAPRIGMARTWPHPMER
uniref:Uncharacterized protein n=1 Tax=Picea glauca TaxID=3330 RepID=A0A117NJ77_PICGL|nr:hypothetical protein ABT39_MTgene969 [Picea glauca]